MVKIKLFVSCHRATVVPPSPLLAPIQVGAALEESRFTGFLYDDDGDNISDKNRSYCELTAQYWAWKHISADYYGFFHYRRYLYPETNTKVPYHIEQRANESTLKRLRYDKFSDFICQYDLLLPIRENMYVSVREHYAKAPFHHESDLAVIEQIVSEDFPEYVCAMEEYFSGTDCYFGNIFIMKQQMFTEYCEWLFHILFEFDRRVNTNNYSKQEQRVDGYLAERLLGVYATYQKKKMGIRIAEIPRVHFIPNAKEYYKNKICNALLPPGTKRRSKVKHFLKGKI